MSVVKELQEMALREERRMAEDGLIQDIAMVIRRLVT